MTTDATLDTSVRMGRPTLGMRKTKVNFPAETLDRIDALVGEKHRSKFIRDAVAGALKTAEHVKTPERGDDKQGSYIEADQPKDD